VGCGAFCGGGGDGGGSDATHPAAAGLALRPLVPDWLLDGTEAAARAAKSGLRRVTGFGGPDPGSNNFVISGALTADGAPIVANDPHLDLFNPPVLYLHHLNLDRLTGTPDTLDLAGAIFPGAPGVGMGFNRHVAWGATYAYHDMADVYLEDVVPCSTGTGDCVLFQGGEVPLTTTNETITLGLLGSPTGEVVVPVEHVPHHGPVLPYLDAAGNIVPRAMTPDPTQALSVRWTGIGPANEIQAFFGLWEAATVADVENALDSFNSVAINLVSADDAGGVFYSASANIPLRDPGAMTWDPATNPGGTAPMFVLPGDGTAEWTPGAFIPERYVPHALNPASGYIATANNDPAAISDDDNPLNDPYYTGWGYDLGYRHARMSALIEAGAGTLDLDAAEAIQADAHSNIGATLRPFVVDAAAALEEELAAPGTHPDLADLAVELAAAPAELALVRDAAALLDAWSLDTPAASAVAPPDPPPTAAEIADSAAASLFNVWLVRVTDRTLGDELAAMAWTPTEDLRPTHQQLGRALVHLFAGTSLAAGTDPTTGDSILFDDLGTPALAESKARVTLEALREALAWLQSPPEAAPGDPPGGFGSSDPMDWRWGDLHTLRLTFPLPSAGGGPSINDLPPAGDPTFPDGYPRHGENFTVDVGNHGLLDMDFTYAEGPAMRFVCRVGPTGPEARIVIPGGEIFDAASPHYDDDALLWQRNASHPFPFTEAEVVAAYESRIVLAP
ncbi:MAG TPA: penicillin acylase family protein, partial [Myxococcota bacterium]|nr:penicillin acylase family protein [Myxococcota bacterium]